MIFFTIQLVYAVYSVRLVRYSRNNLCFVNNIYVGWIVILSQHSEPDLQILWDSYKWVLFLFSSVVTISLLTRNGRRRRGIEFYGQSKTFNSIPGLFTTPYNLPSIDNSAKSYCKRREKRNRHKNTIYAPSTSMSDVSTEIRTLYSVIFVSSKTIIYNGLLNASSSRNNESDNNNRNKDK